jgi:hypothetical protein
MGLLDNIFKISRECFTGLLWDEKTKGRDKRIDKDIEDLGFDFLLKRFIFFMGIILLMDILGDELDVIFCINNIKKSNNILENKSFLYYLKF